MQSPPHSPLLQSSHYDFLQMLVQNSAVVEVGDEVDLDKSGLGRIGRFEVASLHLTMSDCNSLFQGNRSDEGDLDMKGSGWISQVDMLVGRIHSFDFQSTVDSSDIPFVRWVFGWRLDGVLYRIGNSDTPLSRSIFHRMNIPVDTPLLGLQGSNFHWCSGTPLYSEGGSPAQLGSGLI